MQALWRCEGNPSRDVEEAKFPINLDSISPKCWEAYIEINLTLDLRKLLANETDKKLERWAIFTSLANSVGRMSTAEQIMPLPSMSRWYELSLGSYLYTMTQL